MTGRLFPVPDVPERGVDHRSIDRRRTEKRRQMLAEGVHPATGLSLLTHPSQPTCGDCAHIVRTGDRVKTYFKCGLVKITAGPGTDIRKGWPACQRFNAQPTGGGG